MAIKNILFDLGNVLFDIELEKTKVALGNLFGDAFRDEKTMDEILIVIKKFETGKIKTVLFINGLLQFCDKEVQARDIINAWNAMLIGLPAHRLYLLDQLNNKYDLYMLSNINELHIQGVQKSMASTISLEDFESKYFKKVFYSHEIGYSKPNSEAWQTVIDQAKILPSETLFIDDLKENIEGARRLGFHVQQHDPKNDISEVIYSYLKK